MKPVGVFLVSFVLVATMPWTLTWLYHAGGYGACLGVLIAGYVLVNWLMEPYRPSSEPCLFGERGSEAIRRRRWLNPTREG